MSAVVLTTKCTCGQLKPPDVCSPLCTHLSGVRDLDVGWQPGASLSLAPGHEYGLLVCLFAFGSLLFT